MNPADMTRNLREAGLRPTLGRTTVLNLMAQAGGAPRWVALRLARWLADQGEVLGERDSRVVRIERGTPSAPDGTGH